MTTLATVHVGDIGTSFEERIVDQDGAVVDISPATSKTIVLKGPTKAAMSKDADLLADGKDGWLVYKTVKDDISEPGRWQVQAFVVLPTGEWHSEIHRFPVEANLA